MSYFDGITAARNREPVSACPYAPTDPAGADWRQGWIAGESDRRYNEGTFGATDEEKAAAFAMARADNRPDPTVEILGDYLDGERPTTVVIDERYDWTPEKVAAVVQASATMQASMAKFADVMIRTAKDFTLLFERAMIPVPDPGTYGKIVGFVAEYRMGQAPKQIAPKMPETTERDNRAKLKRPFSCPRHGPQPGGFCRSCQRSRR